MIMPHPQDAQFPFSVSFDYNGHDSIADLSKAMQAFSDAFEAYKKSKHAKLSIAGISEGSLRFNLVANSDAWTTVQVMSQDLSDLSRGRTTSLMPERARRSLRVLFEHVAGFRVDLGDTQYDLYNGTANNLLELKPLDSAERAIVHSGVLDRVDLKADQFRIILPHGQRILCSPALRFVDKISECLRQEVPRLTVSGDGRYKRASIIPGTIRVKSVQVVDRRRGFSDLVKEIAADLDRPAIREALEKYQCASEEMLDTAMIED